MKLPQQVQTMIEGHGDRYQLPNWIKAEIDAGTLTPQKLDAHQQGIRICKTCQGLGFIRFDVLPNDYRFGKMYPCTDCQFGQDIAQREIEGRFVNAGLPREYRQYTFDTWNKLSPAQKKGKRKGFIAAKLFCEAPDHYVSMRRVYEIGKVPNDSPDVVRNSLIFQGPPGVCKTGFAACVTNYRLAHKQSTLYIRTQDLIDSLKNTFQKNEYEDEEKSYKETMALIKNHPCLILDEFNVQITNGWRKEQIEGIIRHRKAEFLPTIITCNATIDELQEQWGERTIVVLLAMAHLIEVRGVNLRNIDQSIDREVW